MTVEQNKQMARRAFDALMGGNLSGIGPLLTPEAALHQCGVLDPIPARSLVSGAFPRWRSLLDRQVQLERIIGEGDLVAIHWRTTGRYSERDAAEMDGKRVSFPSMTFIRFEGDKIAEIWNIQDTATMQTQLQAPAEVAGGR